MPLVEIKDFKAVIDNKQCFEQPVKNKEKPYELVETLSKCKEMVTMQEETY